MSVALACLSSAATETHTATGSAPSNFVFGHAAAAAGAPVGTLSKGKVKVTKDGKESEGSEVLNMPLPAGTIIATGDNGTFSFDAGPGCAIEVQPDTQLIVGKTVQDRAVNEMGEPIPEVTVTVPVGTIIVKTDPGAVSASSTALDLIRLPFGRTWENATQDQIRESVYKAVKKNPDRAPDIVKAAIQRARQTGRFPSRGGYVGGAGGHVGTVASDGKQVFDGKQVLDAGRWKDVTEDSLEDLARNIGDAAKEANPAMSSAIDQAVGDALRSSGSLGTSLIVVTPRGNVSPIVGGTTIISSTGADPSTSTVTVGSVAGVDLVTTTEGEQLSVGEGLVVILRPDGPEYGTIQDYPILPGVPGSQLPLPPAPLPPPVLQPSPTPTPTPPPISP